MPIPNIIFGQQPGPGGPGEQTDGYWQTPGTEPPSTEFIYPPNWPDIVEPWDILNGLDVTAASTFFTSPESQGGVMLTGPENTAMQELADMVMNQSPFSSQDVTLTTPGISMAVPQANQGVATGATASREGLQRMLQSYTGRTSLIQAAQRQKAIFTIDRFDGGINLNKAQRDLSYWEACQMDCMSPAQVGRLVRLGDFLDEDTYAMGLADAETENYGLHYFKWSDSITDSSDTLALAGVSPTNYLAYDSGDGGIDLYNFTATDEVSSIIAGSTMNTAMKPVYHDASNRLYVSDASFLSTRTVMCGINDRPNLFPYTSGAAVSYNVSGSTGSKIIASQPLYHAPPAKGNGAGQITVVGTQSASTAETGISNAAGGHNGIYMNIQFADRTGDDDSSVGWGGTESTGTGATKYYYIYASFLYDDGSETKLTVVSDDNVADPNPGDTNAAGTIVATTTTDPDFQMMVIKQVYIDGTEFHTNFPRVHGARFYYTEADANDGSEIGNDKYLFAELDFRYGLKLVSEFSNWNLFLEITGSDGGSIDAASIQVKNAANTANDTAPDGTLSIKSPPTAFTYYTLNLFHQEELKDKLMWKTSTVGNGIAFIGNVKYDGREYTDTMIYSGAGETDSGSAYPMWGTFPVDSNRINIPGSAGAITALQWTNNRVLQFRENAMYLINVEDVLSPRVEGVHQGMGVKGQWAVTETAFGVAWANENGVYAYNSQEKKVRSLTIGRLDAKDFSFNSTSKVGYDDRGKMLIITNFSQAGSAGYHLAYSFITDAWCSWSGNKAHAAFVKSNFAIDHDGYLTGALRDGTDLDVRKWSVTPGATATVEYITKDIDMGKPSLDKRFYTLYISFTGGASQSSMFVYYRVNGMEGDDLVNGWTKLGTVYDVTNPYGANQGNAWGTSADGSTTLAGEAFIPSSVDDLDSTDTGDVQKLAKINLRHLGNSTSSPDDYFKFARSIQFRITGTAAVSFEINDISLVFKEKRIK